MPTVLLLYLGPGSHRRALATRHRAWLEARDVRLVAADDTLSDEDREVFADVLELPPPSERLAEAVDVAAAYCRARRVDAVLAQTELAMLPGALLCDRLGLPGAGVEAALACASKPLTRQRLAAAGVPVPAFEVARDARAVRRFAAMHGYPVVVKAAASAMSRLVTLVPGEDAVEPAVARVQAGLASSPDVARLVAAARLAGLDPGCDPLRDVLVETFVEGAPVEADGLVLDGAPRAFGVLEQVMPPPPRFYFEGYLLPADRGDAERASIERVSDAAVRALGLRRTGFAIELRAAPGEAVSVIEVNGRLGEDDGFADLFQVATGQWPALSAIEAALGLVPAGPPPRAAAWPRAALAYRCHEAGGRVRSVPGARDLEAARAQGVTLGLAVRPGDELEPWGRPAFYPHLAWALAVDPRSSRAAYACARAAVERLAFDVA